MVINATAWHQGPGARYVSAAVPAGLLWNLSHVYVRYFHRAEGGEGIPAGGRWNGISLNGLAFLKEPVMRLFNTI